MSLTNLSPHTNCSECVFPASAHHRGSNKKIAMGDAGPVDGKWKNDGPLRTGARGTRHALDLRRYLGKYWGVRRLYVRRNSVPERGTVPPPPDS